MAGKDQRRRGTRARPVRDSYDSVADEYTRQVADELAGKPFDQELLERFARDLRGTGTVCDMGCGPGHVGRYLADRGVDIIGVDLSPGMIAEARRRNPRVPFLAGDMRALPVADAVWIGVVAFYAIVHLTPEELPGAFAEFRRVLRPHGRLLLAFHVGDQIVHRDEWWERPVCLDFVMHQPRDVVAALRAADFREVTATERDPYPEVEYPSRRAYVEAVRA